MSVKTKQSIRRKKYQSDLRNRLHVHGMVAHQDLWLVNEFDLAWQLWRIPGAGSRAFFSGLSLAAAGSIWESLSNLLLSWMSNWMQNWSQTFLGTAFDNAILVVSLPTHSPGFMAGIVKINLLELEQNMCFSIFFRSHLKSLLLYVPLVSKFYLKSYLKRLIVLLRPYNNNINNNINFHHHHQHSILFLSLGLFRPVK